jgi:transcriptional regulator of acetoin/glycerol metabolism
VAPPGALVCATQTPLRERVEAGTFREDLFHRLSGLVVTLPPLRERSDLQALARAVLAEAGAPGIELSAEVLALLRAHRWPGNLRQLRNVLRSAWAVAGSAGTLQREHLPADFLAAPAGAAPAEAALAPPQAESSARTLGDVEIDTIRAALAACDGNVSLAARRLGVSRNTIYRKLR